MRYPRCSSDTRRSFSLSMTDKTAREGMLNGSGFTLENGFAVSRKGFKAISEAAVFTPEPFEVTLVPLTACNVQKRIYGTVMELAYAVTTDLISNADISFFWFDGNECISAGKIHKQRVASDSFPLPDGVTAFAASPSSGCGIYALVSLSDNGTHVNEIYELSADMSTWNLCDESAMYIPVILVNGRGTQYGSLQSKDDTYEPLELERQNLLSGWFDAYFTTDGHSSVFNLPVNGLDDRTVTCRYYYTPSQYTQWQIFEGESSITSKVGSVNVTMNCDRSSGTVSFTSDDSSEHPLPAITQLDGNNLMLRASRTVADVADIIKSSRSAVTHNSRLYLYGSNKGDQYVAAAKLSCPLYVPEGAMIEVGDSSSAIDVIKTCGNSLYAFKREGIYKLSNEHGKRFSGEKIAGGVKGGFYRPDTLKSELKYSGCGCKNIQTVCECGLSLVWVGIDRRVYRLSPSGGIEDMTSLAAERLAQMSNEQIESMKAIQIEGRYILLSDSGALCCELDNTATWFAWELPLSGKVSSAVYPDGRPLLLFTASASKQAFIIGYGGNEDILPDENGRLNTHPITVRLEITPFAFGSAWRKKAVEAMLITAACKERLQVSFERGGIHFCDCTSPEGDRAVTSRVRPRSFGAERIGFTVSAAAPVRIEDITVLYRELSEVR